MNLPPIVSQTEWQKARDALLAEEKDATRAWDALAAQRRRLPRVRIDQPMRFLYGSILAMGARETIAKDVLRACRWAGWPTWSMNIEQPSQPAS